MAGGPHGRFADLALDCLEIADALIDDLSQLQVGLRVYYRQPFNYYLSNNSEGIDPVSKFYYGYVGWCPAHS